jgi:hypothetical protein
VASEDLGWDPVRDKQITAAVGQQPAPSQVDGAIPTVTGDAAAQKRLAQALEQAGFAEAAGFAIAATPTFRELNAVPMGSTLAA